MIRRSSSGFQPYWSTSAAVGIAHARNKRTAPVRGLPYTDAAAPLPYVGAAGAVRRRKGCQDQRPQWCCLSRSVRAIPPSWKYWVVTPSWKGFHTGRPGAFRRPVWAKFVQ